MGQVTGDLRAYESRLHNVGDGGGTPEHGITASVEWWATVSVGPLHRFVASTYRKHASRRHREAVAAMRHCCGVFNPGGRRARVGGGQMTAMIVTTVTGRDRPGGRLGTWLSRLRRGNAGQRPLILSATLAASEVRGL